MFALAVSQRGSAMYEAGSNIANTGSFETEELWFHSSSVYALTSSFKLLMSVPATHVIPHSTRGLYRIPLFKKAKPHAERRQCNDDDPAPSHRRRAFICGWTGHSACTAEVWLLSHSQRETVRFEKTLTSRGVFCFLSVKMADIENTQKDKMNAGSRVSLASKPQ